MSEIDPKVFVVDDDESVRKGLSRLLRSAGFEAETFSSAEEFLNASDRSGLGCLILDVRMEGLNGLELQARLMESRACCPIIFLTGHGDIPMSVRAMKEGAFDFHTKPVDDELLLGSVAKAIEAHQSRLSTPDYQFDKRLQDLTAREFEVMRCVLGGALNKQIAWHLGIAEKTVKVHRGRVMQKLGVESVASLVRLTIHAGIEPIKI